MHEPSSKHTSHSLNAELPVEAPPDVLFDALIDLRARAKDVPAFEQVEISGEREGTFVATMHENYGGHEVVVISRFSFLRPSFLSYEHVESPFGRNRGRFTIVDRGGVCTLRQVHETDQDVSVGTSLREHWLDFMHQLLTSIKRDAEARAS